MNRATIDRLAEVIKTHLLGVVELTRRVIVGFVTAVFAGVGIGIVIGTVVALIAALGTAGIKVRTQRREPNSQSQSVIDITPSSV